MLKMTAHWSQAAFLVAFGFLVGIFFSAACGGGGGGGGAAASPQATSEHKIHLSTTSGVVVVPASQASYVVRSITFTPNSANDVILYVLAQGTYTATSSAFGDEFSIQILDANGLTVVPVGFGMEGPFPTGSNRPYRLQIPIERFNTGVAASFPSSSYTVRLVATTTGSWVGQIDSVQFKIFTIENVTVVDPSSNISG